MEEQNQNLLEKLMRVGWLLRIQHMHHHRERGPMSNPYGGQGRILAILAMKPEISQKELAMILDIRPQSLGELLSKLEAQGYLTRTPSEEDKRMMMISLTEKGKKIAQVPEELENFSLLLEGFSSEEQHQFSGFLDRLIVNLETQVDSRNPHDFSCRFGRKPEGHDHPGFHRGFPHFFHSF